MSERELNQKETRIFEKIKRYIKISPASLYWINRELYDTIVANPDVHRHTLRMGVLTKGYVATEQDLTSMTRNQLEKYATTHYRGFTMTEIAYLCGHSHFVQVARRKRVVNRLVRKEVVTRDDRQENGLVSSSRPRRSYAGIRGAKYAGYFNGSNAISAFMSRARSQ